MFSLFVRRLQPAIIPILLLLALACGSSSTSSPNESVTISGSLDTNLVGGSSKPLSATALADITATATDLNTNLTYVVTLNGSSYSVSAPKGANLYIQFLTNGETFLSRVLSSSETAANVTNAVVNASTHIHADGVKKLRATTTDIAEAIRQANQEFFGKDSLQAGDFMYPEKMVTAWANTASVYGELLSTVSKNNISAATNIFSGSKVNEIITKLDTVRSEDPILSQVLAKKESVHLSLLSRAASQEGDGAYEITAFDGSTNTLYVINNVSKTVARYDVTNPKSWVTKSALDISSYGTGINSIDVYNGMLACAIEVKVSGHHMSGNIVVFKDDVVAQVFTAGALPDMVEFSPNGKLILSANEGEPYQTYNPEGSITIVDITAGLNAAVVTQLNFNAYDGKEAELRNRGIRIHRSTTASKDLEPEYIAVNDDSTVAAITCQENNAIVYVDLLTKKIKGIVGLGLKDHSKGPLHLKSATFTSMPELASNIHLGGFSGLWYDGMQSGNLVFLAVPDRGPNPATASVSGNTLRPFLVPDYQARIVKFTYNPQSNKVTLDESATVFLTRTDGTTPITGRNNTPVLDNTPADKDLNIIGFDAFGGDLEGIVRDTDDNSFWTVDEYRPAIYHFNTSGTLLARYIPEGVATASGNQAGTYGTETLPAVYMKRQKNRGFEAVAIDQDNNILYAFMQSPLQNDSKAVTTTSSIIRILAVRTSDGVPVAEYVYLLDRPDFYKSTVDKIGDAVFAGNGQFYVIERDSTSNDRQGKKEIYKIDLLGATNILNLPISGNTSGTTLEKMSADDLMANAIYPVDKIKVANLPSLGYLASDKAEGLALLPDGSLAVMNDNDFGIKNNFAYDAALTPITLGLLQHTEGNRLDASDKDNAIMMKNWPIFGMYMPDSIASFTIEGNVFYATANEGDARDKEDDFIANSGLHDIERMKDANIDANYPNYSSLKANAELGRLKIVITEGDLDRDGDIDRIQSFGGRSFSIWDAYGNMVFDSGDEIARAVADATPNYFNDGDGRSDDKGAEPEALAVGRVAGKVYAFIGLERVSGIVVYDVTNPYESRFVQVINTREDGDISPEGMKFIPADKSPNGKAMLAVSYEVSGTVALYSVDHLGISTPESKPLSSVVAVSLKSSVTEAKTIPDLVKLRVEQFAKFSVPSSVTFPLTNQVNAGVAVLDELKSNVLIKWLDPLTHDRSLKSKHFGANADYIAYFGDGWNNDWKGDVLGSAPQFNGSGSEGWMWVNHEYISNNMPQVGSAPNGQHLTFAMALKNSGILSIDVTSGAAWTQTEVDTYINHYKREVGGSFFRVMKDENGDWKMVPTGLNQRFDATDKTRLKVTGYSLSATDHDDKGTNLESSVVAGIMGDCSGGQTPWGTILSGEENVQDYYGDVESAWTGDQKLLTDATTLAAGNFLMGGNISFTLTASTSSEFGAHSNINTHHHRDNYGFLAEIDPNSLPMESYRSGDGHGHRKHGSMGRARWENATLAVDTHFKLMNDQPIVIYAGQDRRGGRVYKWVSNSNYASSMTRAQVRALLDDGKIYVAHFAGLDNSTGFQLEGAVTPTESAPGTGMWIEMSVNNHSQVAPNAKEMISGNGTRLALWGASANVMSVGNALMDTNWNGLAGFPNDNTVKTSLFTAAAKIGVMELNRPEDIEWNPKAKKLNGDTVARLFVAFTNHGKANQLNQAGIRYVGDTATDTWASYHSEAHNASTKRPDSVGSIFAMEEANPSAPGSSMTFSYWRVWQGAGKNKTGSLDAANPDNIMIDADGGVWFGTDGNYGTNGTADGLYYLDLDPIHQYGQSGIVAPTYGVAFRVISGPSDSEATGPAFSSDMKTIFFSVQHPGESATSTWPQK